MKYINFILIISFISGYDWTTVASISQANNPCSTVQCQAGGLCLPLANPPAGQADTTCVCQPGLTGEACETGVTNCDEDPCLHGGQCSQDTVSGNLSICLFFLLFCLFYILFIKLVYYLSTFY